MRCQTINKATSEAETIIINNIFQNINRSNLSLLSTYLEVMPLKVKFDMQYFTSTEKDSCETVACAIGHGPYANIPKKSREHYYTYSCRCLVDGNEIPGIWMWCFDATWKDIDNTPGGVAQRIRFLLRNINNYTIMSILLDLGNYTSVEQKKRKLNRVYTKFKDFLL